MTKKIVSNLVVWSVACFGFLAADSNAAAAMIYLEGTLVPQATLPVVTGSGSATIDIDTVARTLVFQSTYQGLNNNISASHIHAQATASPYAFPASNWTTALNFASTTGLPLNSTGPSAPAATYGPFTYTPANLSAGFVTAQGGNANTAFDNFVGFLSTGQAYFNLHTSTSTPNSGAGNPGGSLGTFFTPVAVPEPSSIALLGFGAVCLFARATRRRRQAKLSV
jgi:Cu/Zn superoxide dismutase